MKSRSTSSSIAYCIIWVAVIFATCSQSASSATPSIPKFVARYDLPNCSAAAGNIATADVNGDGIVDLICTNFPNVITYLGTGDNTFVPGPVSNLGYNAGGAPTPVDLNGDGKVDLIVFGSSGCCGPQGLVVSLGNGDGTFQSGTLYQVGDRINIPFVNYIATGDFNGDGILDIATAAGSGGVYVSIGVGRGVFEQPVDIQLKSFAGPNIFAIDLNEDGKLDLLTGVGDAFGVLLGNGNGTFQPEMDKFVPFGQSSFTLGDFDRDGKVDMFVSAGLSTKAFLYLGEGNGSFHFALDRIVDLGGIGTVVAAADFNGDGSLDIATSAGQVLFGNGQGYFSPPIAYSLPNCGGYGSNVFPVISRQNAPPDLVFENSCLLLNNGKGGFPQGATAPVAGGGAHCAVPGDFNGDGIPDLAVLVDSGLSILLGTGKPSSPYSQGQQISYTIASCPVKADLNGDGNTDLLVTTADNFAVAYLGNGDGTFSAGTKTSIAANGVVALGDFNGDGKVDFALTSNLLAYGNGDGSFQTPRTFIPKVLSSSITGIAAARLSRSTTSDIVLTDNVANLVYVLLSDGERFSQSTFTPQQCPGPVNPVLADINGDSVKDLVIGCNASTVPIYLNNGDGVFTFGTAVPFGVSASSGRPLIADLNGDGTPDLVVQSNSEIAVITGLGGLLFSPPVYIYPGLSPGPVLLVDAQGQMPLSGKPDLVTPDSINSNGAVNVFFNVTK